MARNTWPKNGERYWYVDVALGALIVGNTCYDGTSFDDERLNIGNCYRTKLEAEQAKDRVACGELPDHSPMIRDPAAVDCERCRRTAIFRKIEAIPKPKRGPRRYKQEELF